MNILVDTLPADVSVAGRTYALNTGFRYSLKTILAFEDPNLAPVEKQGVLLANLYQELPDDHSKALDKAIWFLDGGEGEVDREEGDRGGGGRLYSFEKDASMVFSAFLQTHGVDLQTVNLHWWKFLALFMDLGSDTAFCNLVALRKRVKSGKASGEDKRAARDMGEMFNIDEIDTRSLEQKIRHREFMEATKG